MQYILTEMGKWEVYRKILFWELVLPSITDRV